MKKLFITFLFVLLFPNISFAQISVSKTLSRIENSLFGIEYSKQSDTVRLSRIENHVYGEAKSGNIQKRLDALSEDIAANQMGQEITPKRDTFDDEERTVENRSLAQSKTKNEDFAEPDNPKIDYPVVDKLEEEIFGTTYKNSDINTRLSKLENKLFQKTYEDALADRVDRLNEKVAYTSPAKTNNEFEEKNYFYDEEENYFSPKTAMAKNDENILKHNNKNYFNEPKSSNKNLNSKLNKLEKSVFKQNFSQDSVNNRLSRLESRIFKSNFSNDSETTRLNRISSAVNAQKSAKKYDSYSLQQKMATAIQIGMFVLMVVAMIL